MEGMAGAWEVGKEQNIEFQPDTSDLDSNIPERKNHSSSKPHYYLLSPLLKSLNLGCRVRH